MARKPKSNKKKNTHPGCMVLFFGAFLAMGSAFLWFMFLQPLLGLIDARSWEPVEATVLSSEVESYSDSDGGSTYSIEISYAYAWGDREFTSDRYHFLSGSSSGYKGKAKVVDAHPPGSTITCYVNPVAPEEAVIHRGFSWEFLFAFLPLIFIAVGAGGIFWSISAWRSGASATQASNWRAKPSLAEEVATAQTSVGSRPGIAGLVDGAGHSFAGTTSIAPMPSGASGQQELKPDSSPVGTLIGALFICLFWNGLISVFAYKVYEGWTTGDADWFLTLFLTPFLLVGLFLVGFVGHSFLALFNPRLKMTISSGQARPGDLVEVGWQFDRSPSRLQQFTITLEGQEQATYRRGTSTHTDKEVFQVLPIVDLVPRRNQGSGKGVLELPLDLMHTFDASNNKVLWKLKAVGDIPHWPDICQEYSFVVLPAEIEGDPV